MIYFSFSALNNYNTVNTACPYHHVYGIFMFLSSMTLRNQSIFTLHSSVTDYIIVQKRSLSNYFTLKHHIVSIFFTTISRACSFTIFIYIIQIKTNPDISSQSSNIISCFVNLIPNSGHRKLFFFKHGLVFGKVCGHSLHFNQVSIVEGRLHETQKRLRR